MWSLPEPALLPSSISFSTRFFPGPPKDEAGTPCHLPHHSLTNDMLLPLCLRLWDHIFWFYILALPFFLQLYHLFVKLWLDRAKLGVVWQDPRLRRRRGKCQPWNPKIRTWVGEGNPSGFWGLHQNPPTQPQIIKLWARGAGHQSCRIPVLSGIRHW